MSILLLFGNRAAALVTAGVITISAPAAVGVASNLAPVATNTVTVTAPDLIGAWSALAPANTLTLTAPVAVGIPVAVTVAAGPNTLSLTAPVGVLSVIGTAGANTVTLAASAALGVPGPAILPLVANVVTLTAAPAFLGVAGGTDVYAPIIILGGFDRTVAVDIASLQISDVLNETPNTALLTVRGLVPVRGQDIKIYLGALANNALIFAGTVQSIDQVFELKPANLAFHLTCVDYTWLLDGRKVSAVWAGAESASVIAAAIVTGFATGFTTGGVQAGLPSVTDFACDEEDPSRALSRLAALVGAYWYVDYVKDLHFFSSEAVDTPAPLTTISEFLHDIIKTTDISQVRNRVRVEGARSSALVSTGAGVTILPVDDASKFSASGGLAKHDTDRLTYTGRQIGGLATTVLGNVQGPTSAPSSARMAGAGEVTAGVHSYKVAFANSTGETLPGADGGTITAINFLPPTSGPALVPGPSSQVGPLTGLNNYRITNVTARGETDGGPITGRTAVAVAAPGGLAAAEVSNLVGRLIGAYQYAVAFVTALGETSLGSVTSITVAAQTAPASPNWATPTTDGPLIGTYHYRIGFVSAIGETIGAASIGIVATVVQASNPTVTGDGTGLAITYAIAYVSAQWGESALSGETEDSNHGATPVITAPGVPAGCGWRLYSTGSYSPGTRAGRPLSLIAQLGAGVTSFTHSGQSGPVGGPIPTMGRNIPLISIPTGPSGTVARRIYRTRAGGSTYFLVGELGDNSTTTFTDPTPDAALTTMAPVLNTNGKTIGLSGIPIGAGSVMARRLYRTEAGGAIFKRLAELPNNTTTTFTDNTPDAGLDAAQAPITSTAGGQQNALSLIPLGPTGTLARRIYRTATGGVAPFRLVGQLSDNTATTFLDGVADGELGEYLPTENAAGSSVILVSGIQIGGAGVTKRILYRTKAGGSDYFLLDSINDNATSTYIDNRSDNALGDLALMTSTIGALAGDTSIVVASTAGFPAAGWFRADSQLVQYGSLGTSPPRLLGIPASGTGAILGAIKGGLSIVTLPILTGVAGVDLAIEPGDGIALLVEVQDVPAQVALAALLGIASGVREHVLVDSDLSAAEALALATAQVALFKDPETRITYLTRDTLTKTGKTITVALGAPWNISGTFKIQTVELSQIGLVRRTYPLRAVTASTTLFSFEDLLRRAAIS